VVFVTRYITVSVLLIYHLEERARATLKKQMPTSVLTIAF